MSKLYASKFKMVHSYEKDNKPLFYEAGTVFTVSYVEFNMIVMTPVNKELFQDFRVDLSMLNYAFTEN